MGCPSFWHVLVAMLVLFSSLRAVSGIRFVIDREECFSHNVEYDGDTVHVSFVVIKSDSSWHYSDNGVDLLVEMEKSANLVFFADYLSHIYEPDAIDWLSLEPKLRKVKGPSGDQIHDFHDKISEKFEFVAHRKGVHRFCFTNKSPYHETIDFDVHVGHYSFHDEHAKDEHFNPLLDQIGKLEEALYNIQFEQHWLEAQTERQAIVNDLMSRRAIHKAFFESAALIGASVLQVYLLRRLFERKLGMSRV